MSNQSNTKSVRFSNVNIREYEITMGDHPDTSCGPSISLGWKYNEKLSLKMSAYELMKDARGRRDCKKLSLSRWEREDLLFEFGFSRSEINKLSVVKEKERRRRKRKMKSKELIGKRSIKIRQWNFLKFHWNGIKGQ